FVNDELIIESRDEAFNHGRVGLAKFRNTGAEFRLFAVGKQLAGRQPTGEALTKLKAQIEQSPPLAEISDSTLRSISMGKSDDARALLLVRAGELQAKAEELKRLAADLRTAAVVTELQRQAGPEVAPIDLLRAALTIAALDEEDLDVEAYVKQVDR